MALDRPKFKLNGHADRCNGDRELHIMHLVERPGHYRVTERCACAKSIKFGRYVYKTVIGAERAIKNRGVKALF